MEGVLEQVVDLVFRAGVAMARHVKRAMMLSLLVCLARAGSVTAVPGGRAVSSTVSSGVIGGSKGRATRSESVPVVLIRLSGLLLGLRRV